jgi:hypothetical protein
MQDGNKDGCWFMTIGHVFYQEPCPTFFYSQLYRILLMGGGEGGAKGGRLSFDSRGNYVIHILKYDAG